MTSWLVVAKWLHRMLAKHIGKTLFAARTWIQHAAHFPAIYGFDVMVSEGWKMLSSMLGATLSVWITDNHFHGEVKGLRMRWFSPAGLEANPMCYSPLCKQSNRASASLCSSIGFQGRKSLGCARYALVMLSWPHS
jgi:hypothetical protein